MEAPTTYSAAAAALRARRTQPHPTAPPRQPSKKRAKKSNLVDVSFVMGEVCVDCAKVCGADVKQRLRVVGELAVDKLGATTMRLAERVGDFVGYDGESWHKCASYCSKYLCRRCALAAAQRARASRPPALPHSARAPHPHKQQLPL
jgi:hypothetical protein